jgi:microcystin-dependent protein
MADPFLAEIRIVPFTFAPVGWALCDGQVLPIAQNTALFSLLGTMYGGDGRTTFALPDLRGRTPMHPGSGPGLTVRTVGDGGGSETVQLLASQMPAHSHFAKATDNAAASADPTGLLPAVALEDTYQNLGSKTVTPMHPQAGAITGGGQPHNNSQPYLVLNFVIALQGIFPPRS